VPHPGGSESTLEADQKSEDATPPWWTASPDSDATASRRRKGTLLRWIDDRG
jgi:hypothetical protein